jgi:hypothetical protein
MSMYKTGELDRMMESFEKNISYFPGVSSDVTREVIGIGETYKNKRFYQNGQVNQVFLGFMMGYANAKSIYQN